MMPTQMLNQENHDNDVKVKTVYSGDVMITYISHSITLEEFTQEMIAICRFSPDQVFTMKWVDEEGDPCTISTQLELDEALRLYELNRDSELTVHATIMLALALVVTLAVGARADCDVCVFGRCYTTQTLIKGFRVTDQLAIDHDHNVLYTQLNDDQNIALFLDHPEIRLLNTMSSSGMAVDPLSLYLGTGEAKQTFYRYDLSKNTTEAVEPVDMKQDLLFHADKLHLIRKELKNSFQKLLNNYEITDFVVVGDKIVFVSNDTVYVYDDNDINNNSNGQTTPTMVSEKKHVLYSDSYGLVYLGDATQKVIYKYSAYGYTGREDPEKLKNLEIYASYKYGAMEEFVFDRSGHIVFRDADGTVARWVPAPDTVRSRNHQHSPPLCRIQPPHQDHLIQEITSDICAKCYP